MGSQTFQHEAFQWKKPAILKLTGWALARPVMTHDPAVVVKNLRDRRIPVAHHHVPYKLK
jgi:hypothetical protein